MPRYYRRRYTKVVRPKKKWASNMRQINMRLVFTPVGYPEAAFSTLLCANSTEIAGGDGNAVTPTPTIIKTGNFKVQCDCAITTTNPSVVQAIMYILYIPEGVFTPVSEHADYTPLDNIIKRHPEWIMAWKQFGSDAMDVQGNLERVSFSSKLKRNLNSGDQVYAVLIINVITNLTDQAANINKVNCTGMAQFWTCNN